MRFKLLWISTLSIAAAFSTLATAQEIYLDEDPFHYTRVPQFHFYYPPSPPIQQYYYPQQYALPQSTPYALIPQYPSQSYNFGGYRGQIGGPPRAVIRGR